jgi:hypothetical protein
MRKRPILTDKYQKSAPRIKCKISGDKNGFPLLFAGGVVYDKYLLQMPAAGLKNAKVIVPESRFWNGSKLKNIGYITLETLMHELDLVVNQYSRVARLQ